MGELFIAELQRNAGWTGGGLQQIPAGVTLIPQRWSDTATWGPDTATIAATGAVDELVELLSWVGDRVYIRDGGGDVLWWGYVDEIEVDLGGVILSSGVADVANRIMVKWVERDAAGRERAQETAWAEDAGSILRFGKRERRIAAPAGTEATGQAMRDIALARLAWPQPVLRSGGQVNQPSAIIHCKGVAALLDEVYYTNLRGLVEHTDEDRIAWVNASISGTSISFAKVKTDRTYYLINDSANRMAGLQPGDTLVVTGSAIAANNKTYTVALASVAGGVEVREPVETSAAGPNVTVAFGNPRLRHVAQSFTVTTGGWRATRVGVKVQRAGNPTGNLLIELFANAGGSPGTLLDTATIALSALPATEDWVEVAFGAGTTTLGAGTYWIAARPSAGETGLANRIGVALDAGLGYGGGVGRVYDGAAWVAMTPDAEMAFRVLGQVDGLDMVIEMLESLEWVGAGQVTRNTNGQPTWQYRIGDRTMRDLANEILEAGSSVTGRRCLVRWRAEPWGSAKASAMIVSATGGPGAMSPVLERDGRVYVMGIEWRPGRLLAGQWLVADGVLPATRGGIAPLRAVYVESSEYDAERGVLTFASDGATDPLRGISRRIG